MTVIDREPFTFSGDSISRIGDEQRSRYDESKPYDNSHSSYIAWLILIC